MDSFEWNKIFAAVLVAGILASSSGFIARQVIKPHDGGEAHGVATSGGAEAAAAPQMPEPVLGLIAGADAAHGEKLSKACAACHSFDQGGPDGVGPNLWNIMNRGRGKEGGFAYSETLASMGGSWSYADLNKFLWKPKSFVPGTKMNFIGMKKPEDRAALIAWLRTKSATPAPLPSEAQINEEARELAPEEAPSAHEDDTTYNH